MKLDSKIYVAGHTGLVGSAICRALRAQGYTNILTRPHEDLNLTNQQNVGFFFENNRPDYVFLAAAKVGGIHANQTYPADFIYSNLQIQTNVIHAAHQWRTRKLLFLGSSCIYPRMAPQPIPESALLTGPLEPSNDAYAVAKIAGIKMCQAYRAQHQSDFISVMPTNLYGPGDSYHPDNSHVIPGLIRRFHEAKIRHTPVTCWGTGNALREFLHVDDLARACVIAMQCYSDSEILNIGSHREITIYDLAHLVAEVVGYDGLIMWDGSKPDGTPRKFLDSSRVLALGWYPKIGLETGLREAYADFCSRG